jgi:F-box/leucine-rich repeat protein 2/20
MAMQQVRTKRAKSAQSSIQFQQKLVHTVDHTGDPGWVLGLLDALLQQTLAPFLTLNDLVKLDTAMCVHGLGGRERFHTKLAGLTMEGSLQFKLGGVAMGWLLSRKVGLCNLFIEGWTDDSSTDDSSTDDSSTDGLDGDEDERLRHVFGTVTSMEVIKAPQVPRILKYCTNLQSLYLNKGGSVARKNLGYDVRDRHIIALAQSCTGLKSLDLSRCMQVTDAGIVAIAQHCVGLQSLNVILCKRLSDASMVALSQACTGLKSVNIAGCKVTAASIIALAQNCPGLHSLIAPDCRFLNDASIFALAQNSAGLHTLNIAGGRSRVSDASIVALAQTCTGLQSFKAQKCHQLTHASIVALSTCTGLHTLNVLGCSLLADASMVALSQTCTGLHTLTVLGCSLLTDASIVALSQNCTGLHTLDVSRCVLLTDASIVALSQACTGLRSLSVSRCILLTDASIVALAQTTGLQSLDVSFCDLLTKKSIFALSNLSNCTLHTLQLLDVSWCKKITNAAFTGNGRAHQRHTWAALKEVNLGYCGLITRAGVDALLESCPALLKLNILRGYCLKGYDVNNLLVNYPNVVLKEGRPWGAGVMQCSQPRPRIWYGDT